MLAIAGVDYSMNSPAVCIHTGKEWNVTNCEFHFFHKKFTKQDNLYPSLYPIYTEDFNNTDRFYKLAQWVIDTGIGKCDYIGLEGFAYGAKGRAVFSIPEATGFMKCMVCHTHGMTFETFSPGQVKKMATGKGNSKKEIIEEHFIKETGIVLRDIIGQSPKSVTPSSDIHDSYYVTKLLWEKIHLDK